MNPEPLRRSHMVRAAMLGMGVPLDNIQEFLGRLDSLEGPKDDTWNQPLTAAEIAELVMILEDRDSGRGERFLHELWGDIAERHSLPGEELARWADRLRPEGSN